MRTEFDTFCVTAFESGARKMVLNGLGIGWLLFSMIHQEIENRTLISLANYYGQERLIIVISANKENELAEMLLDLWTKAK